MRPATGTFSPLVATFVLHAVAGVYITPKLKDSPGVFITPAPSTTILFSQTTPIIFNISLGFTSKFPFDQIQTFCPTNSIRSDFSPICTLSQHIDDTLERLNTRLNTMMLSLTSLPPPLLSPTLKFNFTKTTATSWADEDSSETQDDASFTTPTKTRPRRQVLLAAGLVGGILGYATSSLFGEQPNYNARAMYESLSNNTHTDHLNILRLATKIDLNQKSTFSTMEAVIGKINRQVAANKANITLFLNSLRQGELRFALLFAEIIQELNRFVDIFSYQNIMGACQNHQLSPILIDKPTLLLELSKLERHLLPLGANLVIPPHQISPLYFLPLTQCHFNPTDKLLTLILHTPIKPATQTASLLHLTSIPFKMHQEICQLGLSHDTVIMVDQPLAIEKTSPTCQLDKGFCMYQHYSSATNFHLHCVTLLLRGAPIPSILEACKYQCRPITGPSDTPIVDLGHQHFAVTNPPPNSELICNHGESTFTQDLKHTEDTPLGSYIVELPPHCTLNIPHFPQITIPIPALKSTSLIPTIYLTLPRTWTQDRSAIVKAMHITDALNISDAATNNFSSIFNPQWNTTFSAVDMMAHIKTPPFISFISHITEQHFYYSTILLHTWLVILTLLTAYLLWKIHGHRLPLIPILGSYAPTATASPLNPCVPQTAHQAVWILITTGFIAIFLLLFCLGAALNYWRKMCIRRQNSLSLSQATPSQAQPIPLSPSVVQLLQQHYERATNQ